MTPAAIRTIAATATSLAFTAVAALLFWLIACERLAGPLVTVTALAALGLGAALALVAVEKEQAP